MSVGAAPARQRGRASTHHSYLTDSLLIVLNPRTIPACMTQFRWAPLDVAYIRGMGEADAIRATSQLIERGGYDRYLIVADDVIVTDTAIRAVVRASRMNPTHIVTGYCNLDTSSSYVNLTRRPLIGDSPDPAAYDFYCRDELPTNGTIRSGFAGLALTTITRHTAAQLLPLGWYGTGWASDFHLSKRCERLGVPIIAPTGGFVWHVKERWNEPDKDPAKQLRLGNPHVVIQQAGEPPRPLDMSNPTKGGRSMADPKIAEKDITKVNDLGQTVVLVPAGQPIPDDLDLTGTSAEGKQRTTSENKARTSSASKRKR